MRFAVVGSAIAGSVLPLRVRNAEISFPLLMALAMTTLGAMPGAQSRRHAARLSTRLRAR